MMVRTSPPLDGPRPPAAIQTDHLDPDAWPTLLFASAPTTRPADTISVRAAYQLALHDRGLLLDTRPEPERDAEGRVHPRLQPVLVPDCRDATEAVTIAVTRNGASRGKTALLVLGGDPDTTARLADALRRVVRRPVLVVQGGFAAWEQWGLPRVGPDPQATAA
ncbi:MAG TPA: hypothetical protein VES01_05150 [Dermatophilaceae bacterium]|nr:hypothetical protein [Dermatophilaceae bacterium]